MKGKCSMSKIKRSGQKPVTVQEALQFLQSAIGYCQKAGMTVRAANMPEGLSLVIPDARYIISGNTAQFHFGSKDDLLAQGNGAIPLKAPLKATREHTARRSERQK